MNSAIAVTRRGLASGPICVPSDIPSPTCRPCACLANAVANSLRILSCTRKRVGEMQTCPALRNFAPAAAFTASATSASSAMITGAWPPSSIVTRFICWPAIAANCLPTGVEPVKVILRITGWGIK